MRSRAARFLIVVFWLVMTGWLVRYEAFPHLFAHTLAGYRSLYSEGPLLLDSWMKITFNDAPLGYSHTRVDINEGDPGEQYVMRNLIVLEMNIMGEPQRVMVTGGASLDVLYSLQHFTFAMTSEGYSMRMDGRRAEGDQFNVRIQSPGGGQWLKVAIPDDVVLHSALTETTLINMEPGEHIRMRTLDPTTLSVADVVVRALRRETLPHRGTNVATTVLATEYQGMEVLSWMSDDGRLLRQETPFGWILEECSAQEAVAWRGEKGSGEDVLGAMAMPCRGVIESPRECRRLRVRFTGLRLAPEEIETERQRITEVTGAAVVMELEAASLPDHGGPLGYAPTEVMRYLEPSAFVQSAHPDLVSRAREIVGGREDSVEAALAIYEWVYRKVRKSSATSLPSALDVLHTMEGDCNEHTYLFVGLARAAGVPAKICLGVVYLDGKFYYHAWPAVYVGRWVEMDPTIGQPEVDATHVFLAEGEGGSQLRLLTVIGQVQAEVLDCGGMGEGENGGMGEDDATR